MVAHFNENAHTVDRVTVNWPAGLRAMAVALAMTAISVSSASLLPIVGATLTAAFGLLVPLQIGRLLASKAFATFLIQSLMIGASGTGGLYVLSIGIDSGGAVVGFAGSLLLLGLLCAVVVVSLRALHRRLFVAMPAVAHVSTSALRNTQFPLFWISLYLPR